MVTKESGNERPPIPVKPRKTQSLPAYWERNKDSILADYGSMTLLEFFKRWSMATTTWQKLKELWHVEGKGPGALKKRQEPQTTNPGGPALEALKAVKYNEHEEYLVLLGYQTAVREMLKIISENP